MESSPSSTAAAAAAAAAAEEEEEATAAAEAAAAASAGTKAKLVGGVVGADSEPKTLVRSDDGRNREISRERKIRR